MPKPKPKAKPKRKPIDPKVYQDVIYRMVANFPGIYNGDNNANNTDLVEWMMNEVFALAKDDPKLLQRAKHGTPECSDEHALDDVCEHCDDGD
jgi:hypothetical protein